MDGKINIKRYALGKYFIKSKGNHDFADIAIRAFVSSVELNPILDREKFLHFMREHKVPEKVIRGFLENYDVIDETYSSDLPDLEMLGGVCTKFVVSTQ